MGYRINETHQDFRVLSEPLEAQHVCWSSLLPLVALNLFNHVEHFRPILTGQWLGTGEHGPKYTHLEEANTAIPWYPRGMVPGPLMTNKI